MAVCVLIPAYEPEERFAEYAALCAQRGPLVVVDDGSGPQFAPIFEKIAALPGCTVLHHDQNKGKGAALKTGFAHILHFLEDCDGVVTADCDGQHALQDVQRLCAAVQEQPRALSLGCRHFGPETPRRSMAGNRATSAAMRILYGIELDDHRAEQAQQQLYRVGFGSFFGSNISPGAFHAVFLNPPYLSVLSENGGRSRDEKRFLIESIPLLMMGGLLIYIVPYYRLTADLCGIICDNFEQVRIHRFLDREFKQFKQVVVTGVRRRRTEAEQDAEALCSAAEHPETLPTADLLPKACYELPAVSKKVETFRGAVFNEDELARQLANSTGFDRLFAKSRLDSEIKRPPLPLSIGQVGLIGGSGLINGLMECDYPHIVKGRIIKEKHTVTDENRGPHGRLISTEIRETISNRMIFNILTPSGFRSLT